MTSYKTVLQKLKSVRIIYLVTLLALLVLGLPWCHSSYAKEKPNYPGQKILYKKGCLNCHFIKGDGGFIGPPLDGIGKYLTQEQIVHRLTSSKPIKPMRQRFPSANEFMRHVLLTNHDARLVAQYLTTLPEADLKTSHPETDVEKFLPKGSKFTPKEPNESSKKGKQKFQDYGCLACHSVKGQGGRLGSALDGVGARRSRTFIESRIKKGAIIMFADKQYKSSKFIMPPSELSDKDISRIVDYLMTLPEIDLAEDGRKGKSD